MPPAVSHWAARKQACHPNAAHQPSAEMPTPSESTQPTATPPPSRLNHLGLFPVRLELKHTSGITQCIHRLTALNDPFRFPPKPLQGIHHGHHFSVHLRQARASGFSWQTTLRPCNNWAKNRIIRSSATATSAATGAVPQRTQSLDSVVIMHKSIRRQKNEITRKKDLSQRKQKLQKLHKFLSSPLR